MACAPRYARWPTPAHLIASNSGWTLRMSPLTPNAAAVPCTRLELLTPSAVHLPRRRPPTRVFLVTTAKSGPGISTRTTANARNSAYFDHDMVFTLPAAAASPRLLIRVRQRRRPGHDSNPVFMTVKHL